MKKRICGLILIFINAVLFSGCWDAFDIKDRTVITLIGVDEQDSKVKILVEYQELKGLSGKAESGTSIEDDMASKFLVGEGESFTQAKESIDRKSPGEIFLGAVGAVVFSEDSAKHGLEEYLNRIRGQYEFRKTIDIFISSSKIDSVFDSKALGIGNVGYRIRNAAEHLEGKRLVYNMSIAEASENMHYENTGYVIGNMDIADNKIEFNGYSIMDGNKKVGRIGADKMKGVNLLLVRRDYEEYTLPFENSKVALSAEVTSKEIKPDYKNGHISFYIDLKLDCKILNFSNGFKLDNNDIYKLEALITDTVKKDIEMAVKESQQDYACDYLNFYKYFKAKYPLEFDNMNWNDKYKSGEFNIDVKARVTQGNLQSFD